MAVKKIKFRTPYDGERHSVSLSFEGTETLTEQHHKDRCSILKIMKQYDRTGLITHVNRSTSEYGDFTTVNEYQENLNMVIAAQDSFSKLPSDIREEFANDPGRFFEFATNPDNADRMVELGLANAPYAFDDSPVRVVLEGGDDGMASAEA